MVEEYAGCFIKVSKSKLPVTRYFILDPTSETVKYFDNSNQLRKIISKHFQFEEVMKSIEFPKELSLQSFKLGPKTLNNFTLTVANRELTFFPWDKESVDKLYQKFLDIKAIRKKNRVKLSECDASVEKAETSTLENGNIYCGEFNDEGLPHGDNCREFCEDGSIFYGSFRNGRWHGTGYIININLDMIRKEYINGEMCGI